MNYPERAVVPVPGTCVVDPVSGGGFISLDTVGPISGKSFTATWDRSGNIYPIG